MERQHQEDTGNIRTRAEILQHNLMEKHLPWIPCETSELQRVFEARFGSIRRRSGSHTPAENCVASADDSKQLSIPLPELSREETGSGGTDV